MKKRCIEAVQWVGKAGFFVISLFCVSLFCGSLMMVFRDSERSHSRTIASVNSFHTTEIEQRAEQLMEQGRRAHLDKNYSLVIKALSELLKSYSYTGLRDEASFLLAHALFFKGKFLESEKIITQLKEYHTQSRWMGHCLLIQGKIHEERNEPSEAIQLYQYVLTEYQDDEELISQAESFLFNVRGL